jgi:hypothetical protein
MTGICRPEKREHVMSRAEKNLKATKRWFSLVTGSICIAWFLTTPIATTFAQEQTASTLDVASLPPIDSIDAQTDITVFLRSGVPARVRLAALRRTWTVDPAIRDFWGVQEQDWDFSDPDSILGFGKLGPEVDLEQMVTQILGETRQVMAQAPEHQPALFTRVMLRLF